MQNHRCLKGSHWSEVQTHKCVTCHDVVQQERRFCFDVHVIDLPGSKFLLRADFVPFCIIQEGVLYFRQNPPFNAKIINKARRKTVLRAVREAIFIQILFMLCMIRLFCCFFFIFIFSNGSAQRLLWSWACSWQTGHAELTTAYEHLRLSLLM